MSADTSPELWRSAAVGASGLLVGFGAGPQRGFRADAHHKVLLLDAALQVTPPSGLIEVVPALVNLLIRFDPMLTDHETIVAAVAEQVRVLFSSMPLSSAAAVSHQVEINYEPSVAPDLESVAEQCGLSIDEVIAAHLGGDYEVLMYGFAPGYAYLGGLPEALAVPRKPVAARNVAAGSVIIAAGQCLVTTLDMPTGWSVIGHSSTAILLDDEDQPFRFAVGDRVEFCQTVAPAARGH